MGLPRQIQEEYIEAFTENKALELLTQKEIKFIKAYMKLNRTINDKEQNHQTQPKT